MLRDIRPPESANFTIVPGVEFFPVSIDTIIDETYENTETFTVSIVSTTNGLVSPERGETTVTIINSDSQFCVV